MKKEAIFFSWSLISVFAISEEFHAFQAISGQYVDSQNIEQIEISYRVGADFTLSVRDVIQNVDSCDYSGMVLCLISDSIVVLIPDFIEVGYEHEYPTSSVKVVGYYESFNIGVSECGGVYLLETSAKLFEGWPAQSYHLVWSNNYGLVAYSDWTDFNSFAYRIGACAKQTMGQVSHSR